MTMSRIAEHLWRSTDRISIWIDKSLARIGAGSLTLIGSGFFAVAVLITVIAVFRAELPDWFVEPIKQLVFCGTQRAELTLDYLYRWGLDEVLWKLVAGAIVMGAGLYVSLILLSSLKRWIKVRDWQRAQRAGLASTAPRIHLKRPLKFQIPDAFGNTHRYEMHIDLALSSHSDIQVVIAGFSILLPALANVGKAVIQGASGQVRTENMAYALSHAARKASDKRITRVDLRATAYSLLDPAGSILYAQTPQAEAPQAQAAEPVAA